MSFYRSPRETVSGRKRMTFSELPCAILLKLLLSVVEQEGWLQRAKEWLRNGEAVSRGGGCASCNGSGFNLGVSPSQSLQGSCGAQVTPGLRQVPTLQWELSGGDGIPLELFQILKDDAVRVLHSTCQQIWKTQQWPQDWKRSVFIPIPKKGSAKECSNYHTIALISHASNVQNSPSQSSAICEPWASRCSSWF